MKPKICLLILSVFLFSFVLEAQDIGGLLKLIQPQFIAQNNAFLPKCKGKTLPLLHLKSLFVAAMSAHLRLSSRESIAIYILSTIDEKYPNVF